MGEAAVTAQPVARRPWFTSFSDLKDLTDLGADQTAEQRTEVVVIAACLVIGDRILQWDWSRCTTPK